MSTIEYHRNTNLDLTATDAMGMTALHIVCCNPNATCAVIKAVKDACPVAASMQNVEGIIPLQLYLEMRGLVKWLIEMKNEEYNLQMYQSARLEVWEDFHITFDQVFIWIKEKMMQVEDLEVLLEFNDINIVSLDFASRSNDETTPGGGLFPFMEALVLKDCSLEISYVMALKCIDILVSCQLIGEDVSSII